MQVSQSSAVRQSNSTGQTGPALSVDQKAFDKPNLDKGLMLSLACAEGNTNADGTLRYLGASSDCPTGYPAKGHRDPGDGMWNKGRLSYSPERHGLPASTSVEECEKRAVDLVKTQMATLETKLQGLGMSPANPNYRFVVANLMDSVNQTGTACFEGKNSLWNHLPQAIQEMNAGKDPLKAMVDCRVRSHANNDGSCGSFNGSWETTRNDQTRRAKEIFDCLKQHGGISGISASAQPAPAPGTSSNSTFDKAPAPAAPPVNLGATTPSANVPGGTEVLGLGAKGPQVSALQEGLNRAGASPALSVDGDFGPATERALKSFQQQRGLEADGVYGPDTATQLTYARPANPSPSATPAAGDGGLNPATMGSIGTGNTQAMKEIKPGSTGPEVTRLKQALADAGFYKGAINNEMGPMGVDALKAAKAALKLGGPADVAGSFTLRKIEEYAAQRGAGATNGASATTGPTPTGSGTAASGVAGLVKPFAQQDPTSCGLASIAFISNAAHAKAGTGKAPIDDQTIRRENGGGTGYLPNVLNQHLAGSGLKSVDQDWNSNSWNDVSKALGAGLPVMISTNGEFSASGFGHYVVLTKMEGDRVQFADPADGQLKWTTRQTLDAQPAHSVDGRWLAIVQPQ